MSCTTAHGHEMHREITVFVCTFLSYVKGSKAHAKADMSNVSITASFTSFEQKVMI